MRILAIASLSLSFVFSAFETLPQSPLQVGSGFTHFAEDSWEVNFLSHPASLAHLRRTGGTFLYTSRFQLTPLNQYSLAAAFPAGPANLALAFTSFGKGVYRETTFSLATGYTIGQKMETGLTINGHELSIRDYGSSRTMGITASVSYYLAETVRWSLLYRNLNSPKLGRSKESLPQVLVTVFDFSPVPSVTAAMELERDLEFRSRYKFGMRWQPMNIMTIATGFISHPGQVTAGISLRPGKGSSKWFGEIGYAIATHPELAISQVFAVRFTLP
ncbi:MAG: hypothetical protein V3U24_03135 [Candidatus Neomarinimicrobiota bacterium]